MTLGVYNNSAAFNVFSSLNSNRVAMTNSMSRLSTGNILTQDDPSGIGISGRMRSQIRSTNQSRQSVDNGISLIQTADAWLQKINDMLSRMKELSVEHGDGTKTNEDKKNLQLEFSNLQDEISRITSKYSAAGKFNGLYLFRGGNGRAQIEDGVSSGNISLHIGADANQKVDISVVNLEEDSAELIGTVSTYDYNADNTLKSSSHVAVTWGSVINSDVMSAGSQFAIGKIAQAVDFVANSRSELGAQQSRLEQARSGLLKYQDNLQAAESKISNVDVARESTELARSQVLSQVSTSMLTQANQIPGTALNLISV